MPGRAAPDPAILAAISQAQVRADWIEVLGERYFNLGVPGREMRNGSRGATTGDATTKAASLLLLKEMLPEGKLTLVSEQEARTARVVPHLFREEIRDDRFEWRVIAFGKTATKPKGQNRTSAFQAGFPRLPAGQPAVRIPVALHAWTKARLAPAVRLDASGVPGPFPHPNFAFRAFPALWIVSPIPAAGETEKAGGFPILSPRYRAEFRKLGLQGTITDPDLGAAITRRVIAATLQPASTFMNALRERVSFAHRAGGRGRARVALTWTAPATTRGC